MKNKYFNFVIFLLFIFLLIGCSKLKEGVTGPDPDANKLVIHPANFSATHGSYYRTNNLTITDCKKCHGADYSGGISGKSCLICHSNSPEACNLCHGKGTNAYPPKALSGDTATTYRGVGAHVAHMTTGQKRIAVKCTECHQSITKFDSPGHTDTNPPSEVIFTDSLANTMTKGRNKAQMFWDVSSLTCKNTYCHGNFTNGNNYSPSWVKVGQGESQCGKCHNLPPGGDHPQLTLCFGCHTQTVDENLNIIDKTKHMNGKVDVYGSPRTDW
jgi:predicted CxxxxCH...CXXCH cytochrome family protein